MNNMLENIFGSSAAGLIGFGLMIVMFMPKVIKWYKDRRVKKKEAAAHNSGYGARYLKYVPESASRHAATGLQDHPEFGEALVVLKSDVKTIIGLTVVWCLPLILVLLLVPPRETIFGVLFIITVFFAVIGLYHLFHLGDKVVFYKTGLVGSFNGTKMSVDYNSIYDYFERPALLPWMAPTQVMRLEDKRLLVLDGRYFKCHKRVPGLLMAALSERVISSQTQEILNRM